MSVTDLLPGGCGVETHGPPKPYPPPGYHPQSPPADLRMGSWGVSDGIYQEAPRRGPTYPCGCLSCLVRSRAYLRHQLSDVAEGLYYLHSCNIVHGDLKGVRA